MPGPFIFTATNRPRDGKVDAEQQQMPELAGLSRRTSRDVATLAPSKP